MFGVRSITMPAANRKIMIAIKSKVGVGTTVSIYLPILNDSSEKAQASTSPEKHTKVD